MLGSRFKDITKDIFYHLGIPGFLLRLSHLTRFSRLFIFTYHRICPSLSRYNYLAIPVDIFEQHIKFIRDNFETVSMYEGLKAIYEGVPNKVYAAVNFDDGYMDNYLYAYPILKQYEVPATVFLTTDFIGKSHIFWWERIFNLINSLKFRRVKIGIGPQRLCINLDGLYQRIQAVEYITSIVRNKMQDEIEYLIESLEREFGIESHMIPYQMLGWRELDEMKRGLISLASHSKSHRNLRLLEDSEVWRELVDSKESIEAHIQEKVYGFSYPFGLFDNRIKVLVCKAGYKYARTTFAGFNHKDSDRFQLAAINAGSLFKASYIVMRTFLNSLYGFQNYLRQKANYVRD